MENLLLVDGHNLLFQMFYGMPNRIFNSDGKPIHGVIGFIGALLKIINIVRPDKLIVIFDGEHHEIRHDILPDYKANRPDYSNVKDEENPFVQLPMIIDCLKILNVPYYICTDFEADDIIAAYVNEYSHTYNITISSFDSDFFQLVSENVKILRYRGKESVIIDRAYIKEKFDIEPIQYAFFKSLVGDTADNVKGLEKIGKKTAAQLVNEYQDIESLIACTEEIKKPSIKKSVENGACRLKLNYSLIKLDNRATIPYRDSEICYSDSQLTTVNVLKKADIY